jgi:tRNA wybutosine-synthesizing protein 3
MKKMPSPLPPSFLSKKLSILRALSLPSTSYNDLSPKGSIDIQIRELIDEINGNEGLVTTSSCSGRVSVFLEGVRGGDLGDGDEEGRVRMAGIGGKGGGGRWLFVSHEVVDLKTAGGDEGGFAGFLGLGRGGAGEREEEREIPLRGERVVRFKFEPFVCSYISLFLNLLIECRFFTS